MNERREFPLFLVLSFLSVLIISSCTFGNREITRLQKLEEGVSHPSTREELKDAITKYEKRVADLQLAGTQLGVWYKMLGTRYLDAKLYGEALKAFEKALEYYPDNQNLYYYVGICAGFISHAALDYDGVGSYEKKANFLKLAESSYTQALRIDDRFSNALYALGILYVYELDENEKAIPILEKLLTIETHHIDGMFALARAYYSTYKFEKAIEIYDKIILTTKSVEKKNEATANRNKAQEMNTSYNYSN